MNEAQNVLGEQLQSCCTSPMTGFYRDGTCNTGAGDMGAHIVCAQMTPAFLAFSRDRGNDLITPVPAYNFPGLKPGDCWCLSHISHKSLEDRDMELKVVVEVLDET